ncbi:MAG: glucosamine 6-phosphate synthetase, partial [Armatimonadetes bacterium]|nr:glucosamine 6-phosphate synthetase [Armatimonadota bacterium]
RGQISAVMVSKLDPKRAVVIKGNMPLEVRYHSDHRVIIYASDPAYLDVALQDDTGWREITTKPMSIMTFHCDDLPHFDSVPFKLGARN